MSETVSNISNAGLAKQRKAVLRVIRNADEQLTANEFFERSKKLLPGISFATVCNSLRLLKEGGHIGEVNFRNGASRFDRKLLRHDHAIYNNCGKLVDMELDLSAEFVGTAADISKSELESMKLTLRELCPNCKE